LNDPLGFELIDYSGGVIFAGTKHKGEVALWFLNHLQIDQDRPIVMVGHILAFNMMVLINMLRT
jgi:hypothetical protein